MNRYETAFDLAWKAISPKLMKARDELQRYMKENGYRIKRLGGKLYIAKTKRKVR